MQIKMKSPLPKELFRILACPLCKSDLDYNKSKSKLICTKCKEGYPIKDNIPVMLPKSMR